MNLEYLNDDNLTENLKLIITPVTPISISKKINGNFWLSSDTPQKSNIYGLLENVMGLHFNRPIREKLVKMLKMNKNDLETYHFSKSFLPITSKCIDILNINANIGNTNTYIDYFQFFSKFSDIRHINGSANVDKSIHYNQKCTLENYEILGKEHRIKSPTYYKSPKRREFIFGDINYEINIKTTNIVKDIIMNSKNNKSAYLGTSESIVKLEYIWS